MLRGQKYEPYGFVSRHPYIKYVSSISDLISKIIDIENGDYTRVQVKPQIDEAALPERQYPIGDRPAEEPGEPMTAQLALDEYIHKDAMHAYQNGEKLYDGSTCSNCSSTRMVRNGTCKVCLDCGSTTGCS